MAGLVSMVALLGLAAAIAAGRVPKLVARTTLVAIATAIFTGSYFVFGFPGVPGASIGQGLILFIAAIVIGVVPAIRVLRA
jgi:serine acetyltransferase